MYRLIDLVKSDLDKDVNGTADQHSFESVRRQEIRQIVHLCTFSTGLKIPFLSL
jgi:hypothetical protein